MATFPPPAVWGQNANQPPSPSNPPLSHSKMGPGQSRGITGYGDSFQVGDQLGAVASDGVHNPKALNSPGVPANQQSLLQGPLDQLKLGDTENCENIGPPNLQGGCSLAPEGYTNVSSKAGLFE